MKLSMRSWPSRNSATFVWCRFLLPPQLVMGSGTSNPSISDVFGWLTPLPEKNLPRKPNIYGTRPEPNPSLSRAVITVGGHFCATGWSITPYVTLVERWTTSGLVFGSYSVSHYLWILCYYWNALFFHERKKKSFVIWTSWRLAFIR